MTTEGSSPLHRWPEYYERTGARAPRPLLIDAVERFAAPGFAIDLGSGSGVESAELLRRGWRVLAIDGEAAAVELVRARVPADHRARLETVTASFEAMELPKADLIWSALSLSFCAPESFNEVWRMIVGALEPGGRIACDLFGSRHAWATNPAMTFVTREMLDVLLQGFDVELLTEHDEDRPTAFDGIQRWHAFEVIARKPHA